VQVIDFEENPYPRRTDRKAGCFRVAGCGFSPDSRFVLDAPQRPAKLP
jgi:hypothetical protein